MGKKLIGFLALSVLLLGLIVGCVTTTPVEPEAPSLPSPNQREIPPASNGSTAPDLRFLPDEPPEDVTWISPGKVQIGNFYPGARAEWDLSIHNGNDYAASFLISYRFPDRVEANYAMPLPEVQDWVIIADPTPVLMPKETRNIMIALDMPEDAEILADKWEFWISIKDMSQTGQVQTELCSRWLVQMRV